MPPACSLLGVTTPQPSQTQPSRFLGLPIEIRSMIYQQLMDRVVSVTISDLEMPDYVSVDQIIAVNSIYPAMMRLNKQTAGEYAFFAIPKILLFTGWTIYDEDTDHDEMQTDQVQRPILPENILNQVRFLSVRTSGSHSAPYDNVQAIVRESTGKMSMLHTFVFTSEYGMYSADLVDLGKHGVWMQKMIGALQELVDGSLSCSGMAKFHIVCPLYSILDDSTEDELPPPMALGICHGPDEETFELDGLHLKFLGTDLMEIEVKATEDRNVLVTFGPKTMADVVEEEEEDKEEA